MKFKNLHLAVSILIIVPVALIYGVLPSGLLKNLFHFTFSNTDISGIFRAIMGLYIAMAIFWMLGILKPGFWFAATLSNVLFMLGLATGRLLSLLLDGVPSSIFLAGLFIEILLAVWGIINLRKY